MEIFLYWLCCRFDNMDLDDLFTKKRWDIISKIAKEPMSTTELSKKLGISVPYILQQLQLLEAHQIVKKRQVRTAKKVGKPKTEYCLSKNFAYTMIASQFYVGKRMLNVDKMDVSQRILQLILTRIDTSIWHYFSKFYWDNINIFSRILSITLIDSNSKKIELMLLSNHEHLDEIRKSISNQDIVFPTGKINIVCWSHSVKEFTEGIVKHDKYYIDLLNKVQILTDYQNNFSELKNLL